MSKHDPHALFKPGFAPTRVVHSGTAVSPARIIREAQHGLYYLTIVGEGGTHLRIALTAAEWKELSA